MKNKKAKNRQAKIQQKSSSLAFKFSDLFSKNYQIITAILIILPLLIYWQVWGFEFVWDEISKPVNHLNNPFVEQPSWRNFFQLFTQAYFAMYIPISYLFWGGLSAFAQLFSLPQSGVLHSANVVLHIVNGLLVFTILTTFISNKWAVLLGTLFFLLHPIQVESVAWVSEFRNLLASFFVFLALYYYLKNQKNRIYLPYIFFILALLSKPSAVVLVPFVFLINHFHFALKLGQNLAKTLPFALAALAAVVITHSAQSNYDPDFFEYAIAAWQRPFAWLDSIVFYLYKLIYPYHLSASYTLSPKFIATQFWFYPLAILPIGLGYLLWKQRLRQPLLLFSSALFVAGFLTTSGLVDFAFQKYSLVTDRYLYFSMLGFALFIAVIFSKISNKIWQLVMIFALLIFALISAFRQIPIWQNQHSLWTHSANYEISPNYAHSNLGLHFNNIGAEFSQAGKPEEAIIYFEKAIAIFPKNAIKILSESIFNIGVSFLHQKKYQQALEKVNEALKIYPQYVNANNFKIDVLTLLKQCQNAQAAVKTARRHKVKLQAKILANLKRKCPKL